MLGLAFVTLFLVLAVVSPMFGTDTSGDRYEDRPADRTWWPAGPDATSQHLYY